MEADFGEAALHGLRRYVRRVSEELGLRGEAFNAQTEPTASAYLALDRRLPDRPDRDVALLWTERHGWALTIETNAGEDLVVAGYLTAESLPPPEVVAEFAQSLLSGERSPRPEPPPQFDGEADLARRLAAYPTPYAEPAFPRHG